MPSLAITGSYGSGKSLLLLKLAESLRARGFTVRSFSADEENRRLLNKDDEVREEIASKMGQEYLGTTGIPDREKLRLLVQTDTKARRTLESIMHPRIRSYWLPLAERHRGIPSSFFVAEIPLLYEKGLEQHFEEVLVIGCSESIRKERLEKQHSLPDRRADRWLAIQQSQECKTALSDHLFWNDGSLDSLQSQIAQFLRTLPTP